MRLSTAALAGLGLTLLAAGCNKKKDDAPAPAPEPAETAPPPARTAAEMMDHARELAHELVIVDGHVDLPYRLEEGKDADGKLTEDPSGPTEEGDFDYPRARAGGLDAPFMSIYIPARYQESGGAMKLADELIDMVETLAADHPDEFAVADTPEKVRAIAAAGKIALPMGIENGAAIEGKLENLEHFRDRGVRYITLTHAEDNRICDSSYDDAHTYKGLSDFGKKVVPEMNRLGIMIDVSHVSDDTFWQVMDLTETPVIASHSSMRHFVPGFERNMDDKMVAAMKKNGGVIMINFGSTFVDAEAHAQGSERSKKVDAWAAEQKLDETKAEDRGKKRAYSRSLGPVKLADVARVADHIDRVVELAGIDHVGFGSDFDGVGPTLPVGLEDVSKYPALIAELLARGYSDGDIEKICSGNVFRVWQAVLDHAAAAR